MQNFERRVTLPVSTDELFRWHERQGAFERLSPPWDRAEVLHSDGHIRDGACVKLKVRGPLKIPLSLEVTHQGYQEGVQFQDRQVRGPFAHWIHTHRVVAGDESDQATLVDSIEYKLPLGPLGALGGGAMVRGQLAQLFHYRHQVMRHDVALHQRAGGRRLHVAISGSSGLLGRELCALLSTGGHRVTRLTRSPAEGARVWKTPDEVPSLDDVDVVIHLAGENVAQRWNTAARARILESRTRRTRALAEAIASHRERGVGPQALICASGIGYYGYQGLGDRELTESEPLGDGFLASVCEEWEAACEPARVAGVRVVNARIGVVLSPLGGALAELKLPFSLGLGGPVGTGEQWMSWISVHDAIGALYECAFADDLEGPVNLTAPNPVKNREFTRALGRALSRPTVLPAPAFALKLMFGEMANETILASQRAVPKRLEERGFPFMHATIADALNFELGRVKLS